MQALGTSIAVAAALSLVTLPIVGVAVWVDFGTALTSAVPDCGGLNVSIACTLGPGLGLGWASLVGVMVGGLAALAMLGSRQPFVLSVLAAIAIMAPANNLHIHYWIILYVLGVVSVARLTMLMRRPSRETSASIENGGAPRV